MPAPLSQKKPQQETEKRPSSKSKETAAQPDKTHQARGSTHRQTGNKQQQYDKPQSCHDKEHHERQPQYSHMHSSSRSQGKSWHYFDQHERPQQQERNGKPSRDRPQHNHQYKKITKDNSQRQPLSDFLPTTFHSGEEYFPPLSHSKVPSHPQHGMKNELQKPMLAWNAPQGPNTGGGIPFSAKQMK